MRQRDIYGLFRKEFARYVYVDKVIKGTDRESFRDFVSIACARLNPRGTTEEDVKGLATSCAAATKLAYLVGDNDGNERGKKFERDRIKALIGK